MEYTPSISVIIPVYKAEKYLHRCVDSFLKQTFSDFEVLLIDDGSPDNSGKICDAYSVQDKRIKVFHKVNGGVSSARQYGLDHAEGEYVIHADPDDWVEPTMLEELYQNVVQNNSDMVICDFVFEYGRKNAQTIHQNFTSLNHIDVLKKIFQLMLGSCCNKLVRIKYLKENDIKFPTQIFFGEDLFVNACLLSMNIKITYVPKAFYHYDQIVNQNSLVHKTQESLIYQSKKLYEMLQVHMPYDVFSEIRYYLLYQQASMTLRAGHPYIDTFIEDYKCIKNHLDVISPSRKEKVLLTLAFKTSPILVYHLIRIFHTIKAATLI